MGPVRVRSILYPLFGIALLMPGCRDRATPIPNVVSDEEYSIYSAWIKHHFKEQPSRLLLASRTFIFDPLGHSCSPKSLQGRVSSSLLRALHDLGEAEYPIETGKFSSAAFKIPWNYEEADAPCINAPTGFRLIAFSRVAFNRDRSEAFFAVSNACGGLCGGGGSLLATRKDGQWVFKSDLGCVWVY